VFPSKTLNA